MGTHGLELLPYTNQSSWPLCFSLILLGQRLKAHTDSSTAATQWGQRKPALLH